jgi:hypothetical protein
MGLKLYEKTKKAGSLSPLCDDTTRRELPAIQKKVLTGA